MLRRGEHGQRARGQLGARVRLQRRGYRAERAAGFRARGRSLCSLTRPPLPPPLPAIAAHAASGDAIGCPGPRAHAGFENVYGPGGRVGRRGCDAKLPHEGRVRSGRCRAQLLHFLHQHTRSASAGHRRGLRARAARSKACASLASPVQQQPARRPERVSGRHAQHPEPRRTPAARRISPSECPLDARNG